MRLRKLGAVLFVVVALAAITASAAVAAAVTQDATWRTGSSGTVLAGSETVITTGSGEMVTTIGSTPLAFKYTGLECLECKIENSSGTAIGSGKVKFTGMTVVAPATCKVNGGAVTTQRLIFKADYMSGSSDMWLFEPLSGTTWGTIKLESGTGSCALNGSYIFSGNLFARASNSTGVYAVAQTVSSSGSINSEGGGALKWGSSTLAINGTFTFALSGAKKGEVFGTHE